MSSRSRVTTVARSFRGRLALRFGIMTMTLAVAGSTFTYLAVRKVLNDRLDELIVRLAEIEVSATADSPGETVHFHDAVFLTPPIQASPVASRYAQVWTLAGRSYVRTNNLGDDDLPLPATVREEVAKSRSPAIFTVRWRGENFRSYLYPLVLVGEEHRDHLLQVATSLQETETVLSDMLTVLMLLALAGLLSGALGGWWLAGFAVRPIVEITREAEAFGIWPQQHRISAHTKTNELNRLVTVLNNLLGRLDESMDLQRNFLADAGHSIKTPLTILRGDIDVALRKERTGAEYEEVLRQSLTDLKDVSALADDLIILARSDGGALQPELVPVDLVDLVEQVARRFTVTAAPTGSTITTRIAAPDTITGDSQLLERALGNLVDNAIKYSPGCNIELGVRRLEGGIVELWVADDGPGIDPSELDHIFERFYRGTQRGARGSGLGLPITRAIVESHNGTISLTATPGSGTMATIRLKALRRPA